MDNDNLYQGHYDGVRIEITFATKIFLAFVFVISILALILSFFPEGPEYGKHMRYQVYYINEWGVVKLLQGAVLGFVLFTMSVLFEKRWNVKVLLNGEWKSIGSFRYSRAKEVQERIIFDLKKS